MLRNLLLSSFLFGSAVFCAAQPTPQLLIENSNVVVWRYQLAAGTPLPITPAATDRILVLDEGIQLSSASAAQAQSTVRKGQALFLKKGGAISLSTESASATVFLVDLRRHWEASVRLCDAPHCVRPVRAGGAIVGETRSELSNGFVSSYRHSLVPGATLASSYYTKDGTDHVVFIPLSELSATFNLEEVQLNAGQPYYSTARDVEVNAGAKPATWVVLRIQVAKK